jgi:hypothetical protein
MERLPVLRELGDKVGTLEGLLKLRGEPVWLMAPYGVALK